MKRIPLESMVGALVVAATGIAWTFAYPASWWGVWHHSAQAVGDATTIAGPVTLLIVATRTMSGIDESLVSITRTASRRASIVWLRLLLKALRPCLVGWTLVIVIVSIAVGAIAETFEPGLLHLAAGYAYLALSGALGFGAVAVYRHPAVPVASAIAWFAAPGLAAQRSTGSRGFDQIFVPDQLGLGISAKDTGYLTAQLGVCIGVAAVVVALLIRNWSSGFVWAALSLGFAVILVPATPLVAEPAHTQALCDTSLHPTLCVQSIHAHLSPAFAESLGAAARIAHDVMPIAALAEHEADLAGVVLGEGRTVWIESVHGYRAGSDLLNQSATASMNLPTLLGLERCPPFVPPAPVAQDENGEPLTEMAPLELSLAGEVFLWFRGEVERQGIAITEDEFLPQPFVSSGLGQQLTSMNPADRRVWFDEHLEELATCGEDGTI